MCDDMHRITLYHDISYGEALDSNHPFQNINKDTTEQMDHVQHCELQISIRLSN